MKFYSDNHHSFVYNIDASHLIQNENVEVFLPENKDDIIAIVKKAIEENKRIICRA
jgi:FAD/FMN-containing dehydrogenase